MKQSSHFSVQRLTLCTLLLALMLVLGYIESLLPAFSAVPGIKLGLSNSILLFAVYMLDIPAAYCLMVLKVLLSGLLFGGVSAILYGFAGGLLSLSLMILLRRANAFHMITVSMVGGAFHNIGQVAVAYLLLRTPQLLYYLAVLILVGLACGALTGFCASRVIAHLPKDWK